MQDFGYSLVIYVNNLYATDMKKRFSTFATLYKKIKTKFAI